MTAKLYAALVQAQQSSNAVGKDGKNSFHGYKYASSEAIIAEAREALSSAGLAVLTLGWSVDAPVFPFVERTKDSPPPDAHAHLVVVYRLVHVSGESVDFEHCKTAIIPEKGRPADKAEATALTYSLGYFLRGLLLLPRVDDALEVDKRGDHAAAAPSEPASAEWDKLAPKFIAMLDAAPDDKAVSTIAADVHKAKPPKAHREKIAVAYNAAIKRLAASNGAAA